MIENIDYYINEEGYYVFTEKHHLERGYCCKNQCKHCPWKYKKKVDKINSNLNQENSFKSNGN